MSLFEYFTILLRYSTIAYGDIFMKFEVGDLIAYEHIIGLLIGKSSSYYSINWGDQIMGDRHTKRFIDEECVLISSIFRDSIPKGTT